MDDATRAELQAYLAASIVAEPGKTTTVNLPAKSVAGSPLRTVPEEEKAKGVGIKGLFSGIGTPGNLMVAMMVLFVLWAAIVPTGNGYSRLELLWETLRGHTKLNSGTPAPPTLAERITHEGSTLLHQGESSLVHIEQWIGRHA